MSDININSLFSVSNLSSSTTTSLKIRDLVASVVMMNAEIEILLGDILKAKGEIKNSKKGYAEKIDKIPDTSLQELTHQFRKIRNICAHESLQATGAAEVIKQCRALIKTVFNTYGADYKKLENKKTLKSAAFILHNEITTYFDHKSSRGTDIGSLTITGKTTLPNEIDQILGNHSIP